MVNFTFRNFFFKTVLCFLFLFSVGQKLYAQTQTFATELVDVDPDYVTNASFAVDGDLNTTAELDASSGIVAGIGAYDSFIEIGYAAPVPANTTTFVRIDTEDELLRVLLGGGLGNLLGDVLGVVLVGNQEFTIEARSGSTTVLSADSSDPNTFDSARVRVVTDADGAMYIAMTPDQSYSSIYITNSIGSLLGLGNTRTLNVRGAFYTTGSAVCNDANYTSFDGDGLSLDLLTIGGAGVTNPENAIDNDPNSFSELSLGILDVTASIEQLIYFDTPSQPTEDFKIGLSVDPTLLALGVVNNITFEAYNGPTLVSSSSLSSLLNLDLLGLLQGGAVVQVPFDVAGPADRIVVRYTSLLGVNVLQKLDLYDVAITPAIPVIDPASEDIEVCAGDSASLVATTASSGAELRWYDSASGGSLLATTASGEAFTTPTLTEDTTFYVASFLAGCIEESARVAVEVTVNPLPESGDITVLGFDAPICIPEILNIVPTTTINGDFNYYLDANGTLPITDGLVEDGITYSINADGELEVEGLTEADSPFRVYVSVVDAVTGCENAPGDLQVVDITLDGGPEPTITLDPVTADNIINAAEAGTTIAVSGSVGGDAEAGDPVVVTVNTFTYNTTVAGDLSFSVDVAGAQLVADDDLSVDASVTAQNLLLCETTVATTQAYTIDLDDPTLPTVDFQITNTDTPTITGTADSVDELTVSVDGITYSEGDGNLIDNGDDTWTLIIPGANALDDGVYDVIATATDAAGNSSSDATTDELTVDTTAPTIPTVNTQETSDTTPTVTGTADSEDTIVVTLNGETYSEGDGDLTDNGNDTWTLDVPAGNELADGTYDVAITATDAAGNSSSDVTVDELVINTTLPTQPTVVSQVTSDQTPTITGTADSADDLTVTVNGVVYAETGADLTDNGDNTWTLVIPVALAEGVYDVTATATQGIQSATDPTNGELTIDITAPAIPTVDFLTTNDNTPTITGTADSSADLVVTVNGVNYPESGTDLTDNGDGTWSLNISVILADGIYDVVATSTDAAGNSSVDATVDELIIDTVLPTTPTVDFLTTNDNTPTITGTADSVDDLVVTVDGVAYPESGSDLTDNGDDTWTLVIPSPLVEGTYDVVAAATDAVGNSNVDATTDELTIDLTDPTVPTVDFLTTNDNTPIITGTADSIDDLVVIVDGITYPESGSDLTDNGNNTWTLVIPSALADGTYDVQATATDAAGNSSVDTTTDELTIDTSAPTVPTVDLLSTSDTTPRLTGTADSVDDLTVAVDGVIYTEGDGDLTDNGDNTWTLDIPVALAEGTYDVVATATNTLGTSSVDATTDELTIDLMICNSPSFTTTSVSGLGLLGAGVTNPDNAIDGDVNTFSQLTLGVVSVAASVEQEVYFDAATQATEDFKVSLSIDPNLLAVGVANNITFEAYNGTTLVSSSTLSSLLSLDLLGLLEDGDIAAIPFDVAGPADRVVVRLNALLGVSLVQSLDFHDIAITSSLPVIDPASEDIEVCAGDSASLVATTASSGAELRWYDSASGGSLLATTASGEAFTTPTLTEDTTFYVASFLAGCIEESARVAVEVTVNPLPESGDITVLGFDAPICIPEILNIVPTTTINGDFNYYLDANGTLPITDGLVEDGITYSINADGELEVEGLTEADSPFRVYVSVVDAVTGCENAPGDLQVVDITLDGGPEPTITLDPVTADNIINAAEAGTTIAVSGSVGGDAEAGDPVVVTVNTFTYNTTVAGDLSFSVDVAGAQLVADDDLSVDASVTAQNLLLCETTVATTQAYTIDLDDPTLPTVDFQITNTDTPTITGTADSVDELTVSVDGITYNEGDGNLIDNGDDTWTLIIPGANALDDGVYDVMATATDAAGNSSSDATTDELTVDTTAPTTPTVNTQETSDTTPTVTGTADSEDTIVVTLNGETYNEGDGDLTDNGNDTWTLNVPAGNDLADGTYDVAITATDAAGNSSSDVTVDELVINTTLPTQPTVVSQVTSDQTPTITGTADSADDLTVTVNGVVYAETGADLTDNGDNTWTLVIPVALAEGVYDVTATATQGIQSATDPTNGELTIDITAPAIPTVDFLTTNDNTPTITGTADSSADLVVTVNGVTYPESGTDLTDNGNDTWSLNIPVILADGTYDVVATSTDAAGNSSVDATVDELIIDTATPTIPTVDFLTTNDNTPTITGTADSVDDLVVVVNGVTYNEGGGILLDNGDDTWSLTIPDVNILSDGIYDVAAISTDAAGNNSMDATVDELTIDTVAPTLPTVDFLTTNDNTPEITGTADSVDDLVVVVNGVTYTEGDGNLVDNGDDTWTLTIPDANALPDGTYDVMATTTDAAGNSSMDATVDELTIDTVAPTLPTVDFLTTNDNTPTITGTADSVDNLTVVVNGVTYSEGDGNLVDNGDDTWTLTIPDANALPDGIYDVMATATDAAGNSSMDATVDELTIDTVAPTLPTVDFLTTNDNTPTITGTADSVDDLVVTVSGDTYTEGDGNLVDNGDDTWTLTIPDVNALPDGIYDVIANATDAAGNSSMDATVDELTIDTVAPTLPTVDFLTTNDTTPAITGSADSVDNLTVVVNGVTYTEGDGNLVDNGDDTWSLTIPDVNALPDGIYDVMATATDAAGNSSVDVTVDELTIDTLAPTLPTVDFLTTNDTTPTITGTADSVDNLTVVVNGVTYTEGDGNLVDNGDDTWTLTIPDANALPDGIYDVMATATDAAGNSSMDATVDELTIDIVAPTLPTVDFLTTNDNTPTITGTADSVDNLTVVVNGVTYTEGDGNLVDNGDDTWTLTIPDANALPDGIYDVMATATDAAGNSSIDATVDELTIDTVAPTLPTVDFLTTNDTTPTITGTADSVDDLVVTVNGVDYAETGTDLIDNGDNTWTLNIPFVLPDGVYDVMAVATDAAGNSSMDATVDELTIDTTDPTLPTVDFLTTNDNTPTITGTADSLDNLVVVVNGVTYVEGDGSLIDNGDDTWSLTIPDANALPDGTYDVMAVATDIADNSSSDATVDELTIDTVAPTLPTVDFLTTNDNTPTITGTADSVDNLTVVVNGVTYTEGDGNLVDNGDDTWSLTIPDANALPDGTYDVMATATDVAGNNSSDATVDELTIDTVVPTLPTVDFLTTNDNTPTITGTADSVDDLVVVVNGVTYTEGDGNLVDNGDDTWSLTIPDANALPDGIYDVMATATDAAGNSSVDATVDELTIDTVAPTLPTVDFLTTNDTTPTITGTADSVDNLVVVVNGVTYSEGDGNLIDNGDDTWSLTIPDANALPDGIYDVMATATDAFGTSSMDVTVDELTIDTIVPTLPTVDPLTTNDTTPTITGTADSVDDLVVVVNGVTYTEGDGNLVDNGDDTWSLTIPDANALPDGTYDVMATATDAAGNVNMDATIDELTIDSTAPGIPTVNSQTTADVTPEITGTADSSGNLTVSVNGVTYTEGDGNLTDNGDDTWILSIPLGNEIEEGVYDVVATNTDALGNSATDATVDELTIDLGVPTGNQNQTFCASDQPTVGDLVLDQDTIVWYASETGGTPLADSTVLSNNTTYYAALVVDGVIGMTRLAVTVLLTDPISATIDASAAVACLGAEITYTTQPGMSNYMWMITPGGSIVSGGGLDDNFITVVWDLPGDNTVDVSFDSSLSCIVDNTASLDVVAEACSDLTISKTVNNLVPAIGEQITYMIEVTNTGQTTLTSVQVSEVLPSGLEFDSFTAPVGTYNPLTGIWILPELAANSSATLTITVTVLETGNYRNVAEIITSNPVDSNSDNNSDEVEIDPDCLMVFNEFSPNGDGMNDLFTVRCIDKYPNNVVNIYNRVGQLVFTANGYNNTWNGVSNVANSINKSSGLPAGTYYYAIELGDGDRTLTGWVYIAR
ncbi:Ig-like domain-containing protein [Leeuwenhoekiella blandensis]|uniref:Ig-like domain-containing protein n=2 Tax=Leeuwenhoekiella blandensis TaxID=360293 RepID=UPI0032B283C2